MNNEILTLLTGQSVSSINSVLIRGWTGSSPCITGALIKCNTVHSISEGTVTDIGISPNSADGVCVTIQYDNNTWFRYCKLTNTILTVGDDVIRGSEIGNTSDEKLRFEYCNLVKSEFPVRFGTNIIYKHDPILYLNDTIIPCNKRETYNRLSEIGTLTDTIYRKI